MPIQRGAVGEAGRVWMVTVIHHPERERIGLGRPVPRRGRLALGRGATTGLPGALDAPGVSREHAAFELAGDGVRVVDLGSKNGTWIDGEPVTDRAVGDGALVQLGAVLVRVHRGAPRVSAGRPGDDGLVGISDAIAALRKELGTVAPHTTSVMILGETGTGKELVARAVHARSGRRGALIPVNCGALPDELLASALFGHVRGAFTGAVKDKAGLVAAAHGGTLLLDELGDASPRLQAALLRVLEDQRFRPVGATTVREADVRWVAAAQPVIEQRVAAGDFRLDLWTRLSPWVLRVPPLGDRPEDIPLLAATFAEALAPGTSLTVELARALVARAWPGNVRELRAAVERLVVTAGGAATIDVQPWLERPAVAPTPPGAAPVAPSVAGPATARRAPRACPPRDELVALLDAHGGNLKALAEALDVGRRTLYRWLERRELDPGDFR